MPIHVDFTDEQKEKVCAILRLGSDRQTAANLLGFSLTELRRQLRRDPDFHTEVLQAEAQCEFRHMEKLLKATDDAKNWRVSMWWLERRAPERYGRRGPEVVTKRQMKTFVEGLANAIAQDVHDQHDRHRLLGTIERLALALSDSGDVGMPDVDSSDDGHDMIDAVHRDD